MKGPLKMSVEREGQKYIDDPIYVEPLKSSNIAKSVAAAFGNATLPRDRIAVGTTRVRLRWIKPKKKAK